MNQGILSFMHFVIKILLKLLQNYIIYLNNSIKRKVYFIKLKFVCKKHYKRFFRYKSICYVFVIAIELRSTAYGKFHVKITHDY